MLKVVIEGARGAKGHLVTLLIDPKTGDAFLIPLTTSEGVPIEEVTLTTEEKLKFQFIDDRGRKRISTFAFTKETIQYCPKKTPYFADDHKQRIAPTIIYVSKELLSQVISPLDDAKWAEGVISKEALSVTNNLKELLKTLQFDGNKAEVHKITSIIKNIYK